jgi:hypothetical protein
LVLVSELRASGLRGRHSTTWVTPPAETFWCLLKRQVFLFYFIANIFSYPYNPRTHKRNQQNSSPIFFRFM